MKKAKKRYWVVCEKGLGLRPFPFYFLKEVMKNGNNRTIIQ